jgi:hypothetical protein
MCRRNLAAVLAMHAFLLAGCLPFGEDTEVLAPNVTAQHLQQVSKLTGIQFPQGTSGLVYLYLGDRLDPCLAAKVVIPADKKDEFLQNVIFQTGRPEAMQDGVGQGKAWWKLSSLTARMDRTLELPEGRFVECALGLEEGQWVVYMFWTTT